MSRPWFPSILAEIVREWVEETWNEREFLRLCVIEALFAGQWRNRDVSKRFNLRDETAVAGIKFRALKRLRELAAVKESGNDRYSHLGALEEDNEHLFDVDIHALWRDERLSCPARHWIASLVLGTLDADAGVFIHFHLDEMKCPWCLASRDDLSRGGKEAELELLSERLRVSRRPFGPGYSGLDPIA